MEDVLGPSGSRTLDRPREATIWEARFAPLDHALLERLDRAAPVAEEIGHAWAVLEAARLIADMRDVEGDEEVTNVQDGLARAT